MDAGMILLLIVTELKYIYIYTYIYIQWRKCYDITDYTYRFQGYGTTIRKTISSPSASVNNLGLLIYGCMWVGRTPGHIPRYMSQTSNNNKRFQLLIPVTLAIYVMIPVLYSCFTFI